MPKLLEMLPLADVSAGFPSRGSGAKMKPQMRGPAGPPQFRQPTGRPPAPQQQQRPGFPPRPGGPQQDMTPDPIEIAEQIALAVGRLEQILKMAKPGVEEQTGAAKKMLRIAHTARLTGNHEAAIRHLDNANKVMDKVPVKLAPLPRPLKYKDVAKRREREQQQQMKKDTKNQVWQKQEMQKAMPPKQSAGGRF